MSVEVAVHLAGRIEPEVFHTAQVHDDLPGLHLGGKIDGAFAVPQPLVAFARVGRGRHVEIGRGVHDPRRQRAEIVARGDFDHAVLHGLEDAGHEGDPDAMAQLDPIETHIRHLPEHLIAVLMAV